MNPKLITAATGTLITLSDAKLRAKIDNAFEDSLVSDLIAEAEAKVGELTGRPLGEQTWKLMQDDFCDVIELDVGEVLEVSSFTYVDQNGDTQDVDPALYSLDLVSEPPRIVRNDGQAWPETKNVVLAVQVTFTAGFTSTTLPASLRRAVLTLVAAWYDDRVNCPVPQGVLDAVEPYRRLWLTA